MNDKQKEQLNGLRGPNAQSQADAKRYVTSADFRSRVDAIDKELGAELRAIYFDEKPTAAAPTPVQPTEAELAAAIKAFPKSRCHELFRRPANQQGESSTDLPKEQYAQAKLAAQFFDIIGKGTGEATVRFNYETKRDRQAKRDALAAEAKKKEAGLTENGLPPGVARCQDGMGLTVVDEALYQKWKDATNDKAVISAALEEVED